MPRDAIVLSDLKAPDLHIVCEPRSRRGHYAVARLMAEHGDAKLPDLLRYRQLPVDGAFSEYLCPMPKAVYESLAIA